MSAIMSLDPSETPQCKVIKKWNSGRRFSPLVLSISSPGFFDWIFATKGNFPAGKSWWFSKINWCILTSKWMYIDRSTEFRSHVITYCCDFLCCDGSSACHLLHLAGVLLDIPWHVPCRFRPFSSVIPQAVKKICLLLSLEWKMTLVLLMEEILHHPGWLKPSKTMG